MRDTYDRVIAADAAPGIYESNYLKANAPDGSGAFWLKHNVLTPAPGAVLPPVAEFWCVLWRDADDWRPRVYKRTVRLADVSLSSERVEIVADDLALRPEHAAGALTGADQPGVSWDLAIRDELPPWRHFTQQWMYEAGFPKKKVVTPSPRAVFDGAFHLGDETIDVDGWVGHRNHNWGTEHAWRYAYGGCNLWDDDADLTVEGFTVQVRLPGGLRSPWLTLLGGLDEGIPYGRGSALGALRSAGRVDWPVWVAAAPTTRGRARLRMHLDPAHAAGLRYLHPDGALSYCYNVKDAAVVLHRAGRHHTSRFGELEFLFPEPIEGVPLHGEASVEEVLAGLG